ncbi:hypothetical protein GOBAR_DD24124 [Gossypium barbadense]|nr:hypothetical protein GOBAR_DD24124 [Gossypium barbadense]
MMRSRLENQRHEDHYSRAFHELWGLVMSLLRSPLAPVPSASQSPALSTSPHSPPVPTMKKISPSGFALLMLGTSVSLMLCGSVTFFIGFMLMPWLLCLVMVLYIAGIVSAVSMLCRSTICYAMAPLLRRKEIPGIAEWKLMRVIGAAYTREFSRFLQEMGCFPSQVLSNMVAVADKNGNEYEKDSRN